MRNPMGPTVVREVLEELTRAREAFPPMNSPHEGYAVILEEMDELWAEVKKRPGEYDPAKARTEAIQVAAMAMRFVLDLCDTQKPNDGPTRPPQSWRDRMAGGPMTFRDATDAERKRVGVNAHDDRHPDDFGVDGQTGEDR